MSGSYECPRAPIPSGCKWKHICSHLPAQLRCTKFPLNPMEVTRAEPPRAAALADGICKKLWLKTSKVKSIPWEGCEETGGMRGPWCSFWFLSYSRTYWKLWVSLIELFLPSTPGRARGLIAWDWNATIFVLLLPRGVLSVQGCPGHRSPHSTQSKGGINSSRPHGHGYL